MVQYGSKTSQGDPLDDVPARGAFAVTPSDATLFVNGTAQPCSRALYIGVSGDVAVRHIDHTTVTYVGVPQGTVLPVAVEQVLATGTTATTIIAMY